MFDPRDYDGETFESEHGYAEARERAELLAEEAEIERALELSFRDTPFCEDDCYRTLAHTAACIAINDPLAAAIAGWRRGQQFAWVTSEEAA